MPCVRKTWLPYILGALFIVNVGFSLKFIVPEKRPNEV